MKNNVIRGITTLFAITLTAGAGRITFNGHQETWYNLPMQKVLSYREAEGYVIDYWVRKDGCKMNGHYIILAAGESVPIGTVIETSRGEGMVLDRHETDENVIDIATTW